MAADPTFMAARIADVIRRNGAPVALRRLASAGTRNSPPTLAAPVLDGPVAAGATVLALRGAQAYGRLVAGDTLTLGGQTVTVAAETASRPIDAAVPGFDAVPLTTAIAADLPDATPVVPGWAADLAVYAKVQSFPRRLVDGQLIRSRDLSVAIGALPDGSEPQLSWQLVIGADVRDILDVRPAYYGALIVRWDLQAR